MVRNDPKSHSVKLVTEVSEPEPPQADEVSDKDKSVGRTVIELLGGVGIAATVVVIAFGGVLLIGFILLLIVEATGGSIDL